MLDWLRNRRKSESEKREEAITAYLDDALSPREKNRFDAELKLDPALQSEVEAQRQIKQLLSGMPRLRAPRNFTLDPAVYGKPEPALAARLYPRLRTATLVASLLFAISLTLNFWPGGPGADLAATPALESVAVLMEEPAAEEAAAEPAAAEAEMAVMEDVAVESMVVEEEAPAAPAVGGRGPYCSR